MKRIIVVAVSFLVAMSSMSYAAETNHAHAKKPVHARAHRHVKKHKSATRKSHTGSIKSQAANTHNDGAIKNSF